MKIACYTDIHNQETMLNLPTTLRTSAVEAARLTAAEWGQVDLGIVGGDNVSDYPHWNRSCAMPYNNWLDIKAKLVGNFAAIAKDERVLYVDGNNDLILGDLPTADNPPYNTCDFYHTGPMKETLGVLKEEEYIAKYAAAKGEQAGLHFLCFHYVIDGVDFFGLNLDPDTAFNSHDGTYSDEALAWLKKKLDAIDPAGNKLLFVVGHLSATVLKDGTTLREDMDEHQRTALYTALAGHRNLFYLYGHVHGQHFAHTRSATGILHFDRDFIPIVPGEADNSRQVLTAPAAFHTVHMGGLRPFKEYTPGLVEQPYFHQDIVEGDLPECGLPADPSDYAATATPRLAQYLLIETYPDRVVFGYRNTGDLPGYAVEDKPAAYTVWLEA